MTTRRRVSGRGDDGHRAPGPARLEQWTRTRPQVADTALAVVLALVLLPSGVEVITSSTLSTPAQGGLIGVLVLLQATVVVRRAWPRTAFLAGGAAMLVLVLCPDLRSADPNPAYGSEVIPLVVLPSSLVFCVLLYTVAAGLAAVDAMRALAVATAGGVGVIARLWNFDGVTIGSGAVLWRIAVPVAVVVAVGVPWQLGRMRRLRSRYAAAQVLADERRRIARELHDVVSHSLAIMVSQAEGARMMAARDPAVAVPALEVIARTGQEAMTGMRALLDAVDPNVRERTPQPGVEQIPGLCEQAQAAGLDVQCRTGSGPVPPAVAMTAYRVVQESLTNALKHAGPGTGVEVSVERDGPAVIVDVRDDGGPGLPPLPGRGLTGMRERVEGLGGDFDAGPGETGFTVRAVLPAGGAS